MSPVLLRATGALALTGAVLTAIAAIGELDGEAPPRAALLVASAEAAASKDSARLISPAEPSQVAGDLLPSSAELSLPQQAAASATTLIGAEPGRDAATTPPSVHPALLAAAARRASELTGAVGGRTSPTADPTSGRANALTEAPSGEAAEMTALLVAPPIPQARPEAPPARREAARKSTRVARAARPSDPPPNCGKKRARWRYVKDVPTWFCR